MATERSEHGQWADEQVQQLIELGINLIDAQRIVDEVLAKLPPGADPATYIFPDSELVQNPADYADDAAADWMAADHIPPRFKRILHAKEETE